MARNIDAVGHRQIAYRIADNWYSVEKEKEIGQKLSAAFEHSTPLLVDERISAYLERLTQKLAQNSDAHIPITLGVVDSAEVYALTFPGGYLYVTRGLLLRVQSEGELASLIARGIAHTALRSLMRESAEHELAKIGTIPLIFAGQNPQVISTSDANPPLLLMFLQVRRDEELDADYFGAQYIYKAGYDPECFLPFVQAVWPPNAASRNAHAKRFSHFPPLSTRLKALEKEIADSLPKRDGAVTTTPEFAEFQKHLLSLKPVKPEPEPQPMLIRLDAATARLTFNE